MEVINESAPHIYHSALPLSPRTSIVRKRFKPYARPFARVVHGLQTSWEPIVPDVNDRGEVSALAWSPCSRFVAVAWYNRGTSRVEVLDGTTLEPLSTFRPLTPSSRLSFSPCGRFLAGFDTLLQFTSWDVQTGGRIGDGYIGRRGLDELWRMSSTHSMDGGVVAAACEYESGPGATTWSIFTYNLISGTHALVHEISEEKIVPPIWTCGDHFRFVTVRPGSITIWKASFTTTGILTEVESLPVTNDICHSRRLLFLPALSRLAFVLKGTVQIWDAPKSRVLLNFDWKDCPVAKSFSSDGRFFACQASNNEICIWKDFPTGYVLQQKLVPKVDRFLVPRLSPNGELIILHDNRTIQLWPTEGPTLSVSITPASSPDFILEVSPDKSLAAVTQGAKRMVMVLDLTSGDPLLMVDTGMEILGFQTTGSTLVVVDQEKVVSWTLPPRDHAPCVKRNIDDSIRTTVLDRPQGLSEYYYTSISPDLNFIIATERLSDQSARLAIYDTSTGRRLAFTQSEPAATWFSPDGEDIWSISSENSIERRRVVVEGGEFSLFKFDSLPRNTLQSAGCPWQSPHGHEVTANGWVRSRSGKLLLWLPRQWRFNGRHFWKGSGRFFGFLCPRLPEPVILEFFPNDLVRAGL